MHRPWWQWVSCVAVLAVAAGLVVVAAMEPPPSRREATKTNVTISTHEKGKLNRGTLREGWHGNSKVLVRDSVIAENTLVTIECASLRSEKCPIRGHDLAGGHELWTADDITAGEHLLAIGSVVFSWGGFGSDAQLAIIKANDGTVIRNLPHRFSLVARSANTLVFDDDSFDNTEAGQKALVAIRVIDGQEVWRHPYDFASEINLDTGSPFPAGLDLEDHYQTPATNFVLQEEDDAVVRNVDTGAEVAKYALQEDQVIIGLFDDKLVIASESDKESSFWRKFSAYRLSDLANPIWTISNDTPGTGLPCDGFICATYEDGGRLLNPENGQVLIHNPKGPMFIRRLGSMAVVQRCDWSVVARGYKAFNMCPAHTSETQIVTLPDMKPMWSGGGLVFVTIAGDGDRAVFILGISDASAKETRVLVAAPQSSALTEVGKIPRSGFFQPPITTKESKAAQMLLAFNLRCVATTDALYCGQAIQPSVIEQWQYAT